MAWLCRSSALGWLVAYKKGNVSLLRFFIFNFYSTSSFLWGDDVRKAKHAGVGYNTGEDVVFEEIVLLLLLVQRILAL